MNQTPNVYSIRRQPGVAKSMTKTTNRLSIGSATRTSSIVNNPYRQSLLHASFENATPSSSQQQQQQVSSQQSQQTKEDQLYYPHRHLQIKENKVQDYSLPNI